jgi:5'-3' exonuclease
MDGDKSDNIDGIERAGLKTICKHFPYLKEEKIHTIDEIITHATDMRNKYVVCENIANGKSILERNYALMQLKDTALGVTAQLHLQEVLSENKIPRLDRNAFYKLIRDDRLTNNMPDYVNWVACFDYCNNVVREGV